MVNYYPETLTVAQLREWSGYKWDLLDLKEVQRLEDIEFKKARGKGTPKKAKTPGECRCVFVVLVGVLIQFYIGESRRSGKRR